MLATKYPAAGLSQSRALGEHPAPNALPEELIKARGGVLPACLPGPDMYDREPQR
ncbi:MAG: hypothetical protein WB766_18645 [Roseiarcus sp.]